MKSVKYTFFHFFIISALKFINKNPRKNLTKVVVFSEKIVSSKRDKKIISKIISESEKKSSNFTDTIVRFFENTDYKIQEKFITNFIINGSILHKKKAVKLERDSGFILPWTILIDPTSKCNLKCKGCWAEKYKKEDNLSFETLNRIINEGKELGIYVFLFSGGEPMTRFSDIYKLCRIHNDCYFAAFTNGTLINNEVADRIYSLGNFSPIISIEGFREKTDLRRGSGTYEKLLNSINLLKEKRILFGVSSCYHHYNYEEIGSEDFFDFIIKKTAMYMWLFTYIPIGTDADTDLCCRNSEREYMYRKLRAFRKTKPIFTIDFWNDAEYVNGCIAGGRKYFHINANGDVEPCAFVHFSDTNIKDVSLKEALNSNLFKKYRESIPFNPNHLMPCPLLDNPDSITDIIKSCKACSTQIDNEQPEDIAKKCTPISRQWEKTAEKIWSEK